MARSAHFREWMFWGIASCLFIAMLLVSIISVSFLAGQVNGVIGLEPSSGELQERFDFDKLNQLLSKS